MNTAFTHTLNEIFPRLCASRMLLFFFCLPLTACNAPGVVPDEADLYVRVVEGNVFDIAPVYGEVQSLRMRRTGFEYRCSECHSDFEHTRDSNRPQGEHREILDRFDHGSNIYCMSCHDQSDRDSFVDNIGQPLSSRNSEMLCARCHGLIFRDWDAGVHGRINGHWNERFGKRDKLTCVQCHDPHQPKFPRMVPSPPPIRSRLEATLTTEKGTAHE